MEFALEVLGWKSFQDLALMYVQQQFGLPAVSFTAGPDRGRDGAGRQLAMNTPHDDYGHGHGHGAIQAKHTGRAASLRISDVRCTGSNDEGPSIPMAGDPKPPPMHERRAMPR